MKRDIVLIRDAPTTKEARMEQNEVILGVDTHLDVHVGSVIREAGKPLGMLPVSTDSVGYLNLLTWENSFSALRRAGVEGAGIPADSTNPTHIP